MEFDNMEEEIKRQLREAWSIIAETWEHLRAKPLEEVTDFCYLVKPGKVLDAGCGNARDLVPFIERGFDAFGFDFSGSMIKRAKEFLGERNLSANLLVADVSSLPFKDNSFNYMLCTRVFHHLPTRKMRIDSLKEVKRTAKDKAQLLLSVWRRYYPRFLIDIVSNLFEKKFEFGDTYKKWEYKGKTYKRFYHLFSLKEFESELKESGLKMKSISIINGSIVARCEA